MGGDLLLGRMRLPGEGQAVEGVEFGRTKRRLRRVLNHPVALLALQDQPGRAGPGMAVDGHFGVKKEARGGEDFLPGGEDQHLLIPICCQAALQVGCTPCTNLIIPWDRIQLCPRLVIIVPWDRIQFCPRLTISARSAPYFRQ